MTSPEPTKVPLAMAGLALILALIAAAAGCAGDEACIRHSDCPSALVCGPSGLCEQAPDAAAGGDGGGPDIDHDAADGAIDPADAAGDLTDAAGDLIDDAAIDPGDAAIDPGDAAIDPGDAAIDPGDAAIDPGDAEPDGL